MGYYDIQTPDCQPIFMPSIITTEQDMSNHDGFLPNGSNVVHFKIVSIGPNTLNSVKYSCKDICEIAKKQGGFFLINSEGQSVRQAMHDLVDRFCNAQEDKNESENQKS